MAGVTIAIGALTQSGEAPQLAASSFGPNRVLSCDVLIAKNNEFRKHFSEMIAFGATDAHRSCCCANAIQKRCLREITKCPLDGYCSFGSYFKRLFVLKIKRTILTIEEQFTKNIAVRLN
jgi:hypothetical protein